MFAWVNTFLQRIIKTSPLALRTSTSARPTSSSLCWLLRCLHPLVFLIPGVDSVFYTLPGMQKVPEFLVHVRDRCSAAVDPAADPDARDEAHQERKAALTAARRDPRTTG
jgi:hypothetical protein